MPLLSVYNNLILGQVHMHSSRFDSHMPSELRDIHRKIRKLNTCQPLYKLDFDEKAQEYTLNVKESSMELYSSLMELSDTSDNGVFTGRKLASSDPASVSVEILDGADFSDSDEKHIEVYSLPMSQINEGRLVAARETGLATGQYSFTVEVEDGLYSFQFNVSGDNTNAQLQSKLADFINKTKVGIRAGFILQKDTGLSRLELSSKSNGSSFKFEDTKIPEGATEGVVEHFGMNRVKIESSMLTFSINDEMIESKDTTYVTKDGLKLSFKAVTEAPVLISQVSDEEKIMGKLSEFVRKYNALSDVARGGAETRKASRKLYYFMNRFATGFSKQLSENGLELTKDFDGKLEIDRDNMLKAIKSGSLEKAFSQDSEFSNALKKTLSGVSLNPMEYIDKTIIIYPNIKDRRQYNPYITSIYSGIMYNNYC